MYYLSTLDTDLLNFISWLQANASSEILTLATFFLCVIAILWMLKVYGALGLFVYNALAIVVGNIQVLKLSTYGHFSTPVALGTVIFTSTFFVNDLLTEHFGPKLAFRSVIMGFWVQLLMLLWMLLALAHPPATISDPSNMALIQAQSSHEAMMQLFTPSVRILLASVIAYGLSQCLEVIIFSKLRQATQGKGLWFRQNCSMMLSGFLDTLIFSALAWRWLSETPFSWLELMVTFVISAQIIRLIMNVAVTPFMYLSYRLIERNTWKHHLNLIS